MTVKEAVIEKLNALPMYRQRELLEFAEILEAKEKSREPRRSLYGILAHLDNDITEDDIREVRKEMWKNFPREHFYEDVK